VTTINAATPPEALDKMLAAISTSSRLAIAPVLGEQEKAAQHGNSSSLTDKQRASMACKQQASDEARAADHVAHS
jgi:hypothetical protein